MKTMNEIINVVIKTAQDKLLLQQELENLKKSPMALPPVEPVKDVAVAELQTRVASLQADIKREKEIQELELRIAYNDAKMDVLKWIVGEPIHGENTCIPKLEKL